jgi:hypothetical protein
MPGPSNINADAQVSPQGALKMLAQRARAISTDEKSLQDILSAARLVWAQLYGEVLGSGNTRDPRLRQFDAFLAQIVARLDRDRAEPVSKGGWSTHAVRNRLNFYRKLVHLIEREGLNRVAEEIQRGFEQSSDP